jgi:hypothetical protein
MPADFIDDAPIVPTPAAMTKPEQLKPARLETCPAGLYCHIQDPIFLGIEVSHG